MRLTNLWKVTIYWRGMTFSTPVTASTKEKAISIVRGNYEFCHIETVELKNPHYVVSR